MVKRFRSRPYCMNCFRTMIVQRVVNSQYFLERTDLFCKRLICKLIICFKWIRMELWELFMVVDFFNNKIIIGQKISNLSQG